MELTATHPKKHYNNRLSSFSIYSNLRAGIGCYDQPRVLEQLPGRRPIIWVPTKHAPEEPQKAGLGLPFEGGCLSFQ